MNVQLNLQEITEAFGATYGSIDIRTAAIRLNESWINILTVVRVSHQSAQNLKANQNNLKSLHVLPDLDNFQVFLSSRPFSDWPSFCNELKTAGRFKHDDTEIMLTGPIDIFSKTGYLGRHHNVLREIPDGDWPTCEISFEYSPKDSERLGFGNRATLLNDRKLTQRISQFGHSSVFDAIDAFMEFTNTFTQNSSLEFHVSLPVFAAIDSVVVNPVEKTLQAKARFHKSLPSPQLFAVCKDSPLNTGLRPKATLQLQLASAHPGEILQPEPDNFRSVFASVPLPSNILISDYVEVKIVSTLGDVDARTDRLFSLRPAEHVHPFFHALKAFCPETEFRSSLIHPQARQLPRTQPWKVQDYFERAVCWFLSSFAFAPAMLGEHETLRTAGSKFQRGSLDILAFNESRNQMLLVGCTLNAPKDEDFSNLMTRRSILLEEIFAESTVHLRPVIFTGLKNFQSYWEPVASEFNFGFAIPIFDGSRIEAALDLIPSRQDHRLFEFLNNPSLSPL